ncbi:MAG TPA: MFS transporter [Kribbella sp.]|nr:MFS transporter [Kribbella sp.]
MPTRAETSWRGLSPTVRILVAARAVNRLGAFTLPFLAVVLTTELGATVGQAGLLLTLFGLATIPSRLLGGQLADRLGRKATILVGLVGCAVAQLWIALAGTLLSALLALTLLGLVFEIYEPPSQAIIADVTAPADRPSAYGLLGAAMAAAAVGAGLLATWLGRWDLRWLFVVDAATCAACALLIAVALPAGAPGPMERRTDAGGVWRDRRLLLMLATGTGFAAIYMQVVLGLPLTMLDRDLPASGIGIVLTTSAVTLVAAQPLLRYRGLRRLDDFQALAVGYLLLTVGLLAIGFADTVPLFVVATVVWSVGDLLLLGRLYSIVAALAPEHARGRYLAAYGVSWGIASAIAPVVGSQLLTRAGPVGLWTTCAAVSALLAAIQPAVRRQLTTPADPPPTNLPL